jgi:branched-chain amino acid transport system ATP-binding protein
MLIVEGIGVAYDGVPALHDVSFSVKQGETVALVGSNGAGKTTTLRAISGLVQPVRGRISFQEQELSREPAHRIVGLGIAHVPEGRRLFVKQTIRENLLLGAYARKGGPSERERREALLERVFTLFPILRERQRDRAGTLSGGQQQMLAIGRGLMSDPKLLMLDEPSLGLSPKLVDAVFDIIRAIKSQGVTVLLVEQNVREALEVAESCWRRT